MNDPTNPLYLMKNNYYRNNYNGITGLESKMYRFPLFALLNEIKPGLETHSRNTEKKELPFDCSHTNSSSNLAPELRSKKKE